MNSGSNRAIVIYVGITTAAALYLIAVFLAGGSEGIEDIFKIGPGSYRTINVFVICFTWLLAGFIVCAFRWPGPLKSHLLFVILFVLLAFFHLNVLREPHIAKRGDFGIYWKALERVEAGEPYPDSFAYPPLLTSILKPLYGLGCREASLYFKITNYISVLIIYLLTYILLQRYGFPGELSAALPFMLLIFNVPLYRAIAYQQITIHALMFVLLGFVLYGRNNLLSAASLCVAVNLKVTPVVLILPFLVNRQWRWLLCFFLAQLGVVAYTCLISDPRYWSDFIYQASRMVEFAYRNSSIDSFTFNLFRFAELPKYWGRAASVAVKVFFLWLSLKLWMLASRRGIFYDGEKAERVLYNGFVVLSLFMIVVSPRMWGHYFVLLTPAFILLLKPVGNRGEFVIYLFAFALTFLVPVFDLFPISYYRLLGIILCYILVWRFCGEGRGVDFDPVGIAGDSLQRLFAGASVVSLTLLYLCHCEERPVATKQSLELQGVEIASPSARNDSTSYTKRFMAHYTSGS